MKLNRREAMVLCGYAAAAPALPSAAFAQRVALTRPAKGPPRNPFLAADTYALTHFDPAQTDIFPYPVARGTFRVDPRGTPRVASGPVNIMTLATPSPDYMWAVSGQGVKYIDVSVGGFREVARVAAPGVQNAPPPDKLLAMLGRSFADATEVETALADDLGIRGNEWLSVMSGGVYSLVDRDNAAYANYGHNGMTIYAFGLLKSVDAPAAVKVLRSYDFSNLLAAKKGAAGSSLVGVNMTYDGKLVVLGKQSMAVIDRGLKQQPQVVRFGDDEHVSNAMCIDHRGGIYVASDKIMRKVVWTGSKLSTDEADGAWAAPYDFGRQPPAVKFGTGTGSTPTLMGFGDDPDQLVVITDGADRMKLVAFWRNEIPAGFQQKPGTRSRRIADQIAVTCGLSPLPEFIQSEQSVVVDGYAAFVVNNMRARGAENRLVDVIAGGPIFEPPRGVERFEWDPTTHSWRSAWARNDVVSTSMVPTKSSASNIVLVSGYTKDDGWEVTGLDWNTGQTVHRTIFGQSNLGNGAYALIQFFPNGDLLFNSIAGPTRVRLEGGEGRALR